MSGDDYDKANIVVNKLQYQIEEKEIEFLKAICEFLLKQINQKLKDVGINLNGITSNNKIFQKYFSWIIEPTQCNNKSN